MQLLIGMVEQNRTSYLDNIEARTEWRPSPDADADEVPGVLADGHHSRGDSHPPECAFQLSKKMVHLVTLLVGQSPTKTLGPQIC